MTATANLAQDARPEGALAQKLEETKVAEEAPQVNAEGDADDDDDDDEGAPCLLYTSPSPRDRG